MYCEAPGCDDQFNWGQAKRYKAEDGGVKVVAVASLAAVKRWLRFWERSDWFAFD